MTKLTNESFQARAVQQHGELYNYSQVEVKGSDIPVEILCKEHGIFLQKPRHHLSGSKCPKCQKSKITPPTKPKVTTAEFIYKAKSKHGEVYDYSNTHFNPQSITIICKTHGEFTQNPYNHLKGSGCPECKKVKAKSRMLSGKESLLTRAIKKHNNWYSYTKTDFELSIKSKVVITCPEHGDFSCTIATHVYQGTGCVMCATNKIKKALTKTTEQFIAESQVIHDGFYTYAKTKYVLNHEKVIITCPVHGDFLAAPAVHTQGSGCRKCYNDKIPELMTYTTEEWKELAAQTHSNVYSYPLTDYQGNKRKVTITCPIHGAFKQIAGQHIRGSGCPRCAIGKSQYEDKVKLWLDGLGVAYIWRDTSGIAGQGILKNLELDFYLPDHNLAIEINGEYWHSSRSSNKTWDWVKNHQKRKLQNCLENGVHLLHFYADEIDKRFSQVTSMIKAKMGVVSESIAARKTEVRALDKQVAENYLNQYHIQGASTQKISKGLFYNNELVALMVFGKLQSHRGNQDSTQYELVRYCSSKRVVGGCSKLLKAFLRDTPECKKVVSYADRRLSDGKMYESMGFALAHETDPDYTYISGSFEGRRHKSNFRRERLARILPNFDSTLTERENCHNHKIYQLFDCGKQRWELDV